MLRKSDLRLLARRMNEWAVECECGEFQGRERWGHNLPQRMRDMASELIRVSQEEE